MSLVAAAEGLGMDGEAGTISDVVEEPIPPLFIRSHASTFLRNSGDILVRRWPGLASVEIIDNFGDSAVDSAALDGLSGPLTLTAGDVSRDCGDAFSLVPVVFSDSVNSNSIKLKL